MISAMRLATVKAPLLARVIHKIVHSEKPEIIKFGLKQNLAFYFPPQVDKTQGAIRAPSSRDGDVKDES